MAIGWMEGVISALTSTMTITERDLWTRKNDHIERLLYLAEDALITGDAKDIVSLMDHVRQHDAEMRPILEKEICCSRFIRRR